MTNTLKHLALLVRMESSGLKLGLTGKFPEDALDQTCERVETFQLQARLRTGNDNVQIQKELVRTPEFAMLYRALCDHAANDEAITNMLQSAAACGEQLTQYPKEWVLAAAVTDLPPSLRFYYMKYYLPFIKYEEEGEAIIDNINAFPATEREELSALTDAQKNMMRQPFLGPYLFNWNNNAREALELLEHDITVYMLHPDNAEEMVFEAEDIIKHDGMFGITQPDWDAVKGHIPPRDVEQRFLNSPTDSMAIYQLRRDAPVELRFASLGSLAAPPDPANYEAIYTREVYPDDDTGRILENFYYIFNDERPGDFVGHSLSVSDIVALKQDGKVSYHYCDSMGFQELPAFQKPENYLKAAEMSMEDDYGMIDGIINNGPKQPTVADLEAQVKTGMSISLMDLAEAAHREKKKSVLEQLKSQPAQERPHKTAPKKSAEKEL